MKQKDFLIQIIEEALEKAEAEWQSKDNDAFYALPPADPTMYVSCNHRPHPLYKFSI